MLPKSFSKAFLVLLTLASSAGVQAADPVEQFSSGRGTLNGLQA
ncbi:hypothetical protein [Roseimaritima sediminicola]|nr:hypothetical protein [Roseimaritima sediminicola]